MSACSIDGCETKYYGRGYCRPHYKWFVEAGHTELPKSLCDECGGKILGLTRRARFCSSQCQMKWHRKHGCYTDAIALERRGRCEVEGCGSAVHANNMCRKHSKRVWKYGDPSVFLAKRVSGPCSIDGCENDAAYAQLCKYHYFKKYIDDHRKEWNIYHGARRSRVKRATPWWADLQAIRAVYRKCAEITVETGTEHNVDHVIPINGKRVCGLHVHWNLQVIPGIDNQKKSNKCIEESTP